MGENTCIQIINECKKLEIDFVYPSTIGAYSTQHFF